MVQRADKKQQELPDREMMSRELVAAHEALSRELAAATTPIPPEEHSDDLGAIPSFEHLSAVAFEPSPDAFSAPAQNMSLDLVPDTIQSQTGHWQAGSSPVALPGTPSIVPSAPVESIPTETVPNAEEPIVQGASLSAFLRKPGAFPSVDWSLDLFQQMCDSFKTFHQNQTFHWQLETSKIQLVEMPKLTDVQDLKAEKKEEAKAEKQEGRDEKPVFSAQDALYVAPEVLQGEPANERSDVYSLAAIFYEVLTDLPPHSGCPFPPNDGRFKEYEWSGMQKVLQQAMSKCPEDRYESVDAFWDAITEARRDPSQPAPSKISQYAGKMQKEMGDHIRKFINGEAKAKTATWINGGGSGGGGGLGLGSPLVDEVVKAVVKEVFGSLMKAGTERVNGAIDKKIAAAQTKQSSWFSRLFQGMKKSMLFMGLMIGMLTAGGVKFVAMWKQPPAKTQSSLSTTKKPKAKKLPLTLRMWRSVRGIFVSAKPKVTKSTVLGNPHKHGQARSARHPSKR